MLTDRQFTALLAAITRAGSFDPATGEFMSPAEAVSQARAIERAAKHQHENERRSSAPQLPEDYEQ